MGTKTGYEVMPLRIFKFFKGTKLVLPIRQYATAKDYGTQLLPNRNHLTIDEYLSFQRLSYEDKMVEGIHPWENLYPIEEDLVYISCEPLDRTWLSFEILECDQEMDILDVNQNALQATLTEALSKERGRLFSNDYLEIVVPSLWKYTSVVYAYDDDDSDVETDFDFICLLDSDTLAKLAGCTINT